MVTATLIVVALSCLAGAALIDVLTVRRLPDPSRVRLRAAVFVVVAAACVLLAVAGFRADLGHGGTISLGDGFSLEPTSLVADPLAGLFLAVTGVIGTAVALAFVGWCRVVEKAPNDESAAISPMRGTERAVWQAEHRGLGGAVALTVASVTLIVLSVDAFVFVFGWEGLSLAFDLLAAYRRERTDAVRDSVVTFGFSKVSGVLLLLGFMVPFAATGSLRFEDWSAVSPGTKTVAYALLLVAFGIKVGLVPVQVWMPVGYAAAPGPARALMSAVAANAGFYGMWRLLGTFGPPPRWIAIVLVLVAALTALLGVAHAAVQHDLPRVIAYSSVENGGLITFGFAIGLVGSAANEASLLAVGLLAATLQMVAHSLGKASLFLGASRFEQRRGAHDLESVRGLGREEPLAATSFTVGALTLAAMPLTVGFVSEWYLLEAVMQLFRLESLTLRMALALAGALLALAIGFAGLVFVRLVGLTVLGAKQDDDGQAREGSRPKAALSSWGLLGRIGLLLPALGCVVVAAASPWEIRFLARGLSPVVSRQTVQGALDGPWVIQPVYQGFSSLSPSWLAVELPMLAAVVIAVTALLSKGSFLRVRRVPAWRSATGGVSGDARYTPFAFAEPARHVLGAVLLPRQRMTALEAQAAPRVKRASVLRGPDLPGATNLEGRRTEPVPFASPVSGYPPNDAPRQGLRADADSRAGAWEGAERDRLSYESDVVELVERYGYRPLRAPLAAVVRAVTRIQSGRLDAYITYVLFALIVVLAVVAAIS